MIKERAGGEGSPSVLYIFDDGAAPPTSWPEGAHVYLVPMTSDYDLIESVSIALSKDSDSSATVIDYAERFNRKAFSTRNRYLGFMADFPRRPLFGDSSIHEVFPAEGGKSSQWWLTAIAEKNTIATDSFARLVALCAIVDLQREVQGREVWVDIEDAQMVRALKANQSVLAAPLRELKSRQREPRPVMQALSASAGGFVQVAKFMVRALMARWVMRGTKPAVAYANTRFLMVTYFPLIDKDAWGRSKYYDKYFGPFQLAAEKKYGSRVGWLAMFFPFDDFGWRRSLKMARQANEWGHPLSFLEQWMSLWDFLAVIRIGAVSALKFMQKQGRIAENFIFKEDEYELRIWPVFESEWYDSFCGASLVRGLVHQKIFGRAFKQLAPGATVLYVAEMLAWEKALNIAAKENGDIKVIGIQHTIVPLLLLNYFNDEIDLREEESIATMPQPDYLACVGKTTRRLFVDSGWSAERVFVWGAIRFQHFRQYMEQRVPWDERDNKVIIALSISPEESKEVLRFVYRALRSVTEYKVVIKGHPASPLEPILDSLDFKLDDNIFSVTQTPLQQLLPTAKAAVITESSAALESIACQCPVVVPRMARFLDLNPLSAISNLPLHVANPKEMREMIDLLLKKSKKSPLPFEACVAFIEDYCEFMSSNDFLQRIELLGREPAPL